MLATRLLQLKDSDFEEHRGWGFKMNCFCQPDFVNVFVTQLKDKFVIIYIVILFNLFKNNFHFLLF